MEAAINALCTLPPQGSTFFKDDYDVIYRSEWTINNNVVDITTVISSPVVWGVVDVVPLAYYDNFALFRLGTITVSRHLIKLLEDGYEIIADGSSQFLDFYQTTFPCGEQPIDNFCFHFNCSIADNIDNYVTCGSAWVDSDNYGVLWGNVHVSGDVEQLVNSTLFQWIDVWNNDEELTAGC